MYQMFEALGDYDQTEGRGGSVSLGLYENEEDAVRAAQTAGAQGTAGQVDRLTFHVVTEGDAPEQGSLTIERELWWGRKRIVGQLWHTGYADFREIRDDPEFIEYVKLCRLLADS